METAGDGGTYGMALLAQYLIGNEGKNLPSWLDKDVFKDAVSITIKAGGGRMRRLQCIPR